MTKLNLLKKKTRPKTFLKDRHSIVVVLTTEIMLNSPGLTNNSQIILRISKEKAMMKASEIVYKVMNEMIDGMMTKALDEMGVGTEETMAGMMGEIVEEIVKSIKAEAQWDGPIGWIASLRKHQTNLNRLYWKTSALSEHAAATSGDNNKDTKEIIEACSAGTIIVEHQEPDGKKPWWKIVEPSSPDSTDAP